MEEWNEQRGIRFTHDLTITSIHGCWPMMMLLSCLARTRLKTGRITRFFSSLKSLRMRVRESVLIAAPVNRHCGLCACTYVCFEFFFFFFV